MSRVHARDSLLRGACSDIYDRFNIFVGMLEKAHGLRLAYPYVRSVGDIKKFCSGLIEGQSNHPWKSDFRRDRASLRTRMSISHSLFLFRKLLPSEKPQLAPYVEKMSTLQDPVDPVFLDFVRISIRKMFPTGWDTSYRDKCVMSTLPTTSCYEDGRSRGGCRGLDQQTRWDREDFCSYVLESVVPRQRGVSRVEAVETGGKWRVISIPPRIDNALRPFHQSLYDFVSKQKWCLRGDATPARFKDFTRNGEVFVSGDYESATDNLNSEVQSTILCELIMRARSIPRGIALHALSTFSSLLECDGDVRQQARGQLMGQLLSFPLLCLSNYLTFKFSVRRDVPVLINGDDIVFRACPDEVDHWRENVGKSGLVLSAGKTLIHNRFFTLNSCMFDAGRKVTWVPFVRAKALWGSSERECEKISSIGSRFYSFAVGYGSRRRAHFEHVFLTENAHTILRSRRSVTRGLGMKVSEDVLRSSGFWNRELFYLEKEVEPPLPTLSFVQLRAGDIPKGWTKVSPHWYPPEVIRGKAFRFAMEVVNCAWSNPMISDSDAERKWMQKCDEGCSTWGLSGFVSRSMCRLLKMSRRQLWRYVCMRGNRNVFGRVRFSRGKGVWMSGTAQQCENEESETTCVSNCAVSFGPPVALLSGVRMV